MAVLGLLAFVPGVAVRQFVRLYPKGHERRRELVAETYVRPFHERLFYVAQCLEVSLAEGIPARRAANRAGQVLGHERTAAATGDQQSVTIINLADFSWDDAEVTFPVGDLGMGVGAEFTANGARNRVVGVNVASLVTSVVCERLDMPKGAPRRTWTLPLPFDAFGEFPPARRCQHPAGSPEP